MLYDAIILTQARHGPEMVDFYSALISELGLPISIMLTIYFNVELFFRIYASGYVSKSSFRLIIVICRLPGKIKFREFIVVRTEGVLSTLFAGQYRLSVRSY